MDDPRRPIIVFKGESFLLCACDERLATSPPIFLATELIVDAKKGVPMKPQDLWQAIYDLTHTRGTHKLEVVKNWSISTTHINKKLDYIRFWYLNGAVPATYSIEQFAQMPIYEANDLLEKLRIFA